MSRRTKQIDEEAEKAKEVANEAAPGTLDSVPMPDAAVDREFNSQDNVEDLLDPDKSPKEYVAATENTPGDAFPREPKAIVFKAARWYPEISQLRIDVLDDDITRTIIYNVKEKDLESLQEVFGQGKKEPGYSDVKSVHWISSENQIHIELVEEEGVRTVKHSGDQKSFEEFQKVFQEEDWQGKANSYFKKNFKEADQIK